MILFIGAGHMASAIIGGSINKEIAFPQELGVYDVDKGKYPALSERGINTFDEPAEGCAAADIIVLAMRPLQFPAMLKEMAGYGVDFTSRTIVSLGAGVPVSLINNILGDEVPVIRTMPNTPLLIGRGVTALSRNAYVSDSAFKQVSAIFSALGEIIVLNEDMMNSVVCVNGSSPAYIYLLAKSMLDAAAEQGFNREAVYPAVVESICGAAEMLRRTGKLPDQLIREVAVPGGTTERALAAFERGGFTQAVADGMRECTARARELCAELEGQA